MSKKRNNTPITLDISALGFEGGAIAKKDDMVYFVKGAVPGDKVNAIITRKKKSYREAFTKEILEFSPDRVDPKCEHFGVCGGCKWQQLSYEKQLFWKKQHVIDAFQRIAKVEYGEMLDTMESPNIFNYRNKMEFSFGWSRWVTDEEIANNEEIPHKNFGLGLHIPGRFDKILDVNKCHLQVDSANEILELCRNKALELDVPAYNQRSHEGFLRNLMIRSTIAHNEIMALLITDHPSNDAEKAYLDWFANDLIKEAPQITNLGTAINDTKSPVTVKNIKFFHGADFIREQILGVEYQISPTSFFQTNSCQLDRFIGEIINYAGDISDKVLWDLYCGTGSITLPAAKKCKEIYGIELVESSIIDAKANAERNDIKNAKFYCADLHLKETPDLLNTLPKPDVIMIDPPRAGMHKNLIPHILQANAKTIVYVSCNPATQARDCELLAEKYEVKKVQPVDMFPHTYHVESIALLERKDG